MASAVPQTPEGRTPDRNRRMARSVMRRPAPPGLRLSAMARRRPPPPARTATSSGAMPASHLGDDGPRLGGRGGVARARGGVASPTDCPRGNISTKGLSGWPMVVASGGFLVRLMNAQTRTNPANEKSPPTEQPARTRYLVDFYDELDFEWANFSEPTFDTIQEAIETCGAKQAKLPKVNRDFGDHYGVISLEIGREVSCSREIMAFSA